MVIIISIILYLAVIIRIIFSLKLSLTQPIGFIIPILQKKQAKDFEQSQALGKWQN